MLLSEIASFINLGVNNRLQLEQVYLIMDAVQKNVFQKNQQAFLVYDQKLTILTQLNFVPEGSNFQTSDIGNTVTGADSGATGVLVSIHNDDNYIVLSGVDGEFESGEVASDGSHFCDVATDSNTTVQHGWRGPYDAPTDPACRKIWGVTKRPPHLFWVDYMRQCGYWYSIDGVWQTADYRANWWEGRMYPFITGNTFDLSNQFLFSFTPTVDNTDEPYYWVYWKNPPDITQASDSSDLLVPEAYHFHFANACQQFGQAFLEKDVASLDKIVQTNLSPWVDTLLAPFRSQWRASNMTQERGTDFC